MSPSPRSEARIKAQAAAKAAAGRTHLDEAVDDLHGTGAASVLDGAIATGEVFNDADPSSPAGLVRPTMVSINRIVPYWRNPRMIPEEAVNAVTESIKRFGYQQPIVVDTSMTIVIGHTRYAAMRRLGVTEVAVQVIDLPPDQIKGLRVLDNRVAELTNWDFDALAAEVDGLDSTLLHAFFPTMVPSLDGAGSTPVVELNALGDPATMWDQVDRRADFICPGCYHSFEIDVTLDAVKSGTLKVAS